MSRLFLRAILLHGDCFALDGRCTHVQRRDGILGLTNTLYPTTDATSYRYATNLLDGCCAKRKSTRLLRLLGHCARPEKKERPALDSHDHNTITDTTAKLYIIRL